MAKQVYGARLEFSLVIAKVVELAMGKQKAYSREGHGSTYFDLILLGLGSV